MKRKRSIWGWLTVIRSFRIHIAHDDHILPETRWLAIWITTFFLAGFIALTIWPDESASMFAWDIHTRVAVLVLGAACGAGFYFFSRVYLARQWHVVGLGFLPAATFSILALAETFVEWDAFNYEHTWFVMWMVLFTVTPWIVPLVWIRNRSTDPRIPGIQEILLDRKTAQIFNLLGVLCLGAAALLYLIPGAVAEIWPWNLETVTARILGALFAGVGVMAMGIAHDRRWTAVRILLETTAVFLGLALLGVARAWRDLRPGEPLTWIFIFGAISLLGFIVVYYLQVEKRYRGRLQTQV
ncbi:MAG: hypothetical protein M1281_02515 [Chloroflexi bacterium]|nr:hypothetical protein [Chloroflexota bacterium]